jgi:hypothetical protein
VGLLKISPYRGSIGVIRGQGIGIYDEVKQYLLRLYKGAAVQRQPLRLTNEFSIKLLAFNLWVHPGDAMQVGKRNPLGTVTFTGIDFAANRQTGVVALL